MWTNRFHEDNGSTCYITVDGTDCPIFEPTPFDRMWYSHKFHGPALRYEVGVCIQTGWMVWKNGPYPAGAWSDLKIARDNLLKQLLSTEKVLADGGYRDGGVFCETPSGLNNSDQKMKAIARSRHETLNRRLKQYAVLVQAFRHDLQRHVYCFHAIANIVQLDIMNGNELFSVEYCDWTEDVE